MQRNTGKRRTRKTSKTKNTRPVKNTKQQNNTGKKQELRVVNKQGPRPNSMEHAVKSHSSAKKAVKKRRGTKKTLTGEFVVLSVTMIFFIISIGGSLFNFVTRDNISVMVVAQGSLDRPQIIQGMIIRDETVYYSDTEGEVTFHVADTDRVRAGTVVSSVQNVSAVTALEAERDQLSRRILEMQEQRSNVSTVSSDVAAVNNTIKNTIDSNMHRMMGNDFTYIYTLQANIEQNLEYRNELLLNENRGTVHSYVNENRQYTNRISEFTSGIAADSGGIVSYRIDGFEDVFTFENMEYITKEQVAMEINVRPTEMVRTVMPEDPVFKIVNTNDWYIAAYIPNDLVIDWNENSTVEIYIETDDGFEPLAVRIYSIYRGERESFVIFHATRRIIDFLNLRSVNFKTYDSMYSGIKLPESAIVEKTFLRVPTSYVETTSSGSRYVTKLVNESYEPVYITTKSLRNMDIREDYVYVMQDYNNLKRGDVIVNIDEDGAVYRLEDIVTAKGVYKTNNGVAVFTSIYTENMIEGTGGYVILDTDSNSGTNGINVYDRIVSDAANINISEGDKIN